MLEIVRKEEYLQDGIPYIVETFSNGAKAKYIKPNETTEPTPEPPLTEQEQAIMDTAINTEYLVCLADMGL